jgi:hypothetical protein
MKEFIKKDRILWFLFSWYWTLPKKFICRVYEKDFEDLFKIIGTRECRYIKICDDVYVSNFKVNGSSIKVENNLFLNTNYLYLSERIKGEDILFKKLKRCYRIN